MSKKYKTRKAILSDAETIAKLITYTWKISYKDILPDPILEQRTYEQTQPHIEKDIQSDDKIVFVAVDHHDQIIGMVSGGSSHNASSEHDGELYALYVLPEYQRKRIGKLLFSAFNQWLKANHFKSLILWVLKVNEPSRKFYERCGGKIIAEKKLTIADEEFDIIAYGWIQLV